MAEEPEGGELGLFGSAGDIAVQRGLAEFRGRRPVRIVAGAESLVALPLDGLSEAGLAAFRAACAPAFPWLAITRRRARVLGLDATGPRLLRVAAECDLAAIWFAATSVVAGPAPCEHRPGGPAALAAIQLAKLAYKLPALLVVDPAEAPAIAREPAMVAVPANAVARFRDDLVGSLVLASRAQVPLRGGIAAVFHVFRDAGGASPTAIVIGEPDFSRPVPVRLHSACLTGDVFGSRRCDCGAQLQLAIERLAEGQGGIILYLEQEGRGLGLANKMRTYALQDEGLDTVDANTTLGFEDDERDYGVAARMLEIMGCRRVLLMTNNPGKLDGLSEAGIEIAGRVPLYTPINADNRRYLAAKAARAGHWLDPTLNLAEDETEPAEPGAGG